MATETALDKLLKDRKDANAVKTLATGVWYSGFNAVKATAITSHIPLVSVWANNGCYLCKRFEGNLVSDTFKEWMKDSNCLFTFGWSGDAAKEDKVDAKNWAWGQGHKLKAYPFMRVYLADEIDDARTGDQWNGRKKDDEGAANIIAKLEEVLG